MTGWFKGTRNDIAKKTYERDIFYRNKNKGNFTGYMQYVIHVYFNCFGNLKLMCETRYQGKTTCL